MADIAEYHPRLLPWLAEGRVGGLWNVFGVWVSVLRLIPGIRWLVWRVVFRPVASVSSWRAPLHTAVQLHTSSAREPIPFPAGARGRPGVQLSAMSEEAVIVPTRTRGQLDELIVGMSSGCVGVSGLRGAGKSALIQDFCALRYGTPRAARDKGKYPSAGLRIMVRAPVSVEPRDFLVHLYTSLCQAVLADVRFNPTTLGRQLSLPSYAPSRIRLGALFGVLSGVLFFAVCGWLIWSAAGFTRPPLWPLTGSVTFWEIIGAVVTGLAGIISLGWRTLRASSEVRQVVNLASEAEHRLRRLEYQRTDTSSAGGALSMPGGAGLTTGTSHQFTRQIMALPELIDDYRDFAQRVIGGLEQAEFERQQSGLQRPSADHDYRAYPVRLVIGIDQIDMIEDPGAACRFLDDLSAAFGTPNCVYLLAVSADTMAAVDQRSVPRKTSSAGLFDEMIWVQPLHRDEARTLLHDRGANLTADLTELCYALSGGLPRELLRIARSALRADPHRRGGIVDNVIAREVTALKHRALASAAAAGIDGTLGLIEILTDENWPWDLPYSDRSLDIQKVLEETRSSASRLLVAQDSSSAAAASGLAIDVCDNLIAGLYYLLTVHAVFKHYDNCFPGGTSGPHRTLPAKDHVLDLLAKARIGLGLSPELAAEAVSGARWCLREAHAGQADLTAEIEVPFLDPVPRSQPHPFSHRGHERSRGAGEQ